MATLKAEITDQDEPIAEVPSWSEVSSLPDFQKLSYPEQRRIALDWAGDVKREASYRGEFTEDEAKEVDDFVANAVQPDIETKAKAIAEGAIRGGLSGVAATLAGRAAFAAPIPAVPRAIAGFATSALAQAGVDELVKRGIERFAPGLTEAAELAPEYATGGQIAGMAGSAAPAISRTAKALSTIAKAEGGKAAVQQGAKLLVPAAAIGAATDTGIRAITGQDITPSTVASSALLNTLFAGYGANTRIANYTRDEARDLFQRVASGKGGLKDADDVMAVMDEMLNQRAIGRRKPQEEIYVPDFERAKRTTVDILGKRVVDKTELEGSKFQAPQDVGSTIPRLKAPQRPIRQATVVQQEQLPEAGVRGNVRGTQADTAAMQRREIIAPMQESLINLNEPAPRTNVFTTESQGINREAIIPDTRGLQGEIVREGPIVTPRTQLPSGERLALPAEGEFRPTRKAEEAAAVIELEKGMEERIRQSPQGAKALGAELGAGKTTIPRPMRGKPGEEGMVAGELLTKPAELYKTFLTSTGDLPKKLFDIVEARGTQTQAMLRQVQFTARDIESEIKKALAQTPAKDKRTAEIDIRKKISLVERGQAAPETLPENVAGVVVQMRRQIDNLSDALIESGVFSEELPIEKNKFGGYDVVGPSPAQRVRENRGAYITRTYERDYNPKFSGRTLQKRDAAKYAQAESMFRQELKASRPNITEQEIKAELELISKYSKENLSPSQKVTGLGKDLGITKQRQEIPWYRKYLMGETTEPVANYVISTSRMIELLQTQRMLNSIRSDGIGKYLFEKPTGNATKAIAAEGSQTLAPLNGLYADPKLISALKDVDSVANLNLPAKMYAMANSVVKMGKTVLSVQAQLRNPVANIAIEIANGNPFFIPTPANIGAITKSVKAIWADWGVPLAQKPEYRQYLKRAVSLGVYDNTTFNELRDIIRDAQGFNGDGMEFATKILEKGIARLAKAPIRGAMDTYKANDNFFKLIGWEHEIKQLMDGTKITREQAEPLAAEIVKNTRPTQSRVPPLIKKFRQQPFFGNFISWPSEIVRTMFNMAKVSYDQIRTPGMEYYGYKRALLGLATIAGVNYATSKLGQLIAGVTKEKIDAIRRFVAPFQKNAELMPISKNNKEMSYIDISYTSPWEILYQPYRAAMSGENFEEAFLGATQEFLESYASPGILTAAAASTVFGQTPSGKKIRNPEDPPGDQFLDTLSYFIRQIEPATASQIRRNYYGFTGQTDPLLSGYGRVYNASEEALALLGVRPSSINYAKALEGKSSRFNTRMSDVSRIFTEQYGSVGSKAPSEIRNAYSTMDRQRKKLFNEANKDYHASMVLGLSRSEAISAMRAGGISEANALAISKNKYTDYQISRDLSQTMKDTLKPEELRKREAIARELRIKDR